MTPSTGRLNPILTIFILASRAIPLYLQQSIDSARNQISDLPVDLIISLNGPAKTILKQIDFGNQAKIQPRRKLLTASQHMRACIEECNTDYIMLFHDDDILAPGYLERVCEIITSTNPDLIISNCKFFKDREVGGIQNTKGAKNAIRSELRISREEAILFAVEGKSINFASCIYKLVNVKRIENEKLLSQFGKYSDRPFMFEAAGPKGTIYFCEGQTVFTRVHPEQDSHQHDPEAALYLYNLLAYYSESLRHKRFRFLLHWPYACLRGPGKEVLDAKLAHLIFSPFSGKALFALPFAASYALLRLTVEGLRSFTAGLGTAIFTSQ